MVLLDSNCLRVVSKMLLLLCWLLTISKSSAKIGSPFLLGKKHQYDVYIYIYSISLSLFGRSRAQTIHHDPVVVVAIARRRRGQRRSLNSRSPWACKNKTKTMGKYTSVMYIIYTNVYTYILYHNILYYIIIYYIILYFITLYYVMLCYIIKVYIILYYLIFFLL